MLQKILIFVTLIAFSFANAQSYQLTENSKVSLLTVGTANASHSLYGHTALRIQDENLDLVYNYGMFDFSTPNFALRFVKGDMQYFAAAYDYYHFENNYRQENRTIWEQQLNLSLEQKNNLFQNLNQSLQSADKYYTYKFIDRNCTTKVLDQINQVIAPNSIVKNNIDPEISYRAVLNSYLKDTFFLKLGINIMFGSKVDEVASTLFLPDDLMHNLDQTTTDANQLTQPIKTIFEANHIATSNWYNSIGFLTIVLIAIVLINKKMVTNSYLTMQGLLGIFLLSMSFYSQHEEIWYNYNALLFNPLYVLLGIFKFKNKEKLYKIIWLLIAISLVSYLVIMLDKDHFSVVWPFILTNVFLLRRKYLK